MAFRFKGWIFDNLYTKYDRITDPNKDADGRGTHERVCEVIEGVLDEEILDPLESMTKNLVNPLTLIDKYVVDREISIGYKSEWKWIYQQPMDFRRNLLSIMAQLFSIRSTKWAYSLMLSWKGWVVVIDEVFVEGGFDSPYTFDSDERTFDSFCPTCTTYSLNIVGADETGNSAAPLYDDSLLFIAFVVEFNQPINLLLTKVIFNGQDITNQIPFGRKVKLA